MPITPTYPGVYIEEIPSGVRTIAGVATSITAFIGRALRGPVNEPVTINNYGDYERVFGGLWLNSAMSYAVRDYFQNGGGQAVIVRLYHPYFDSADIWRSTRTAAEAVELVTTTATKAEVKAAAETKAAGFEGESGEAAAKAIAEAIATAFDGGKTMDEIKKAASDALEDVAPITKARLHLLVSDTETLDLEAAYEGSWGNSLRARVDYDVSEDVADDLGVAEEDLFNLSIYEATTGTSESFRNLTVIESPRQVDKVLENESILVRVLNAMPATPPAENDALLEAFIADESDTSDEAAKAREDAKADLQKAPIGINQRSVGVADTDKATDGAKLDGNDFTGPGLAGDKEGLYALENADLFNLLCIPPHSLHGDIEPGLVTSAAAYCEKRRAIFLVDSPSDWKTKKKAKDGISNDVGTRSKNAALFFPRLRKPNPLRDNQMENFVPCGAIAGVIARTDTQRGIWKAPAGLDATLVGIPKLSVPLTDAENGELNPLGINCMRAMGPAGRVIWGARTLKGDDRLASEWKYISVRRMALYIEESLYRGTHWVVFEPNDEPLWAQIRLNVGAFMHNLFRQGAFQGTSPREAYFVKCSKETTTQNDINLGIVNILVGFAPLKPAEFVIIKLQQIAGQVEA